jgi:hypothetical protein
MLGIKKIGIKSKHNEEDEKIFSLPLFIAIINLAFESYFFPLNTLWQLFKFTKS